MTNLMRTLLARLGTVPIGAEDGGVGGLILAVMVVVLIVVVALFQWVF